MDGKRRQISHISFCFNTNGPSPGTTAATAKVSGRLRDVNGKAATRVAVTITNLSTGEILAARTDLFGRYAFTELPTRGNYLVRVFSRRHTFGVNERFINLLEDVTDVNFTTNLTGTKPDLDFSILELKGKRRIEKNILFNSPFSFAFDNSTQAKKVFPDFLTVVNRRLSTIYNRI